MADEDSPQSALVGARSVGDLETVRDAEAKVLRDYLLAVRGRFSTDLSVREAVAAGGEGCQRAVMEMCSDLAFPGTEDVYERAVAVLLEEHGKLAAAGAGAYVVDQSTGLAVFPLTDGAVFRPQDYVGEDGKAHKARPILHPGISSALALVRQERERTEAAVLRGGPAYEHLRDPASILRAAEERLAKDGVEVGPCPGGQEMTVEIGREQVDGALQGANPAFHRLALFGEVLALRVLATGASRCELGQPRLCQDARQRWYTVSVRIPGAAA